MTDTTSYIESICVIPDEGQVFEATLYSDGEIEIHVEDSGDDGVANVRYSLGQARTIHAALGHLIWLGEQQGL